MNIHSEAEIDEFVEVQVAEDAAWDEAIQVHPKYLTLLRPDELATRYKADETKHDFSD